MNQLAAVEVIKMFDWWNRSTQQRGINEQTEILNCANLRSAFNTIYVFALFHCTCFSTLWSCANWFVNKIMLRRFKSKVQTASTERAKCLTRGVSFVLRLFTLCTLQCSLRRKCGISWDAGRTFNAALHRSSEDLMNNLR